MGYDRAWAVQSNHSTSVLIAVVEPNTCSSVILLLKKSGSQPWMHIRITWGSFTNNTDAHAPIQANYIRFPRREAKYLYFLMLLCKLPGSQAGLRSQVWSGSLSVPEGQWGHSHGHAATSLSPLRAGSVSSPSKCLWFLSISIQLHYHNSSQATIITCLDHSRNFLISHRLFSLTLLPTSIFASLQCFSPEWPF